MGVRQTRSIRRWARLRSVLGPIGALALIAATTALSGASPFTRAAPASAASSCPANGCAVTVNAREYVPGNPAGNPLPTFNFVVNVDNTRLVDPATRQPRDAFPKWATTESNSPVVAEGDETHPMVSLPVGRYLISVRSLGHKMWGKYVNLPADADTSGNVTAQIDLTRQTDTNPLPLGKIKVFVFADNAWTNGAPDTEENGLVGFKVGLHDQIDGEVSVDYNNNPLCQNPAPGGPPPGAWPGCVSDSDGFVSVDNLGPATYFIDVTAPSGPCNSDPDSHWYQTTTIDGGLRLQAGVEEGSDGTGAPGEQLWEAPNKRTAYWFGFVCAPQPFATAGTGEIVGTARNWQGWPPFDVLTYGDPVENPFVALSDSTTDRTVFVGRGDAAGNFDIQGVPAGTYNLAIWDEQLSYIMRFKPVTVGAGQAVDVTDTDVNGNVGIGVSRWFGWLAGDVYLDQNGNGVRDPGEPTIPNTDMDQRWRDGSIKEATTTDGNGHYEYPTAEGGALGKWFINEQGFATRGVTGASVHDEHTGAVTHIPSGQGGNLLSNQLVTEGHRATVDWGKYNYPANTPGQIIGITYFATTRNEFDARFQVHETYEPAIPDVTVYLETPGPDGQPNTADDVIVNKYVTDHWQQPAASQTPSQPCPITDKDGTDISGQLNPQLGPACLETPITGQQSKDGAFDGGYAFATYCPTALNLTTGSCTDGSVPDDHPLVAGTYITHAIMPKTVDTTDTRPCNTSATDPMVSTEKTDTAGHDLPGGGTGCVFRPVKEEDVNVDLGNSLGGAIPPPPCAGDDHLIDQATLTPRSTHFGVAGAHAPLCDKRLVVLTNGQNANADFHLMTNFRTDPNGTNPSDVRTGDVAEAGRLIGLVSNDIYFERDKASIWYGEPRPIGGIPIGIYQRVDTVPNVNQPYDENNWRLFTTIWTTPEGTYEALLPPTETFNCPIPQGPCPNMYLVKVNDPGSKSAPNAGYDPNLLTATSPWDIWPGLTDQLDTPLDPISGTACEDPAVPARPELLEVSTPVVNPTGSRQVVITGDFIGTAGPASATGGRVLLTDVRTGAVTTLTRAPGGGIASWVPGTATTPDLITINIPAINTTTFRPGPKQVTIVTAQANGGVSSVNGITLHVRGANGTGTNAVSYMPNVVTVPPPSLTGPNVHALQNAIDSAPSGSLLVLAEGTYNENVLAWKPLIIQGVGPGGIIGAHELLARDPEDPRAHVPGSVIDGRYFQQNAATFDGDVAAHAPYALANAPLNTVLRGADVTFVAQSTTAYGTSTGGTNVLAPTTARLDGVGLMTGRGDGAGGVQLMANINNAQITNNILENNGGIFAGGIGLGQPFARGSNNKQVRIANDRLIGNGGLTTSGGIGLFYGSDNYDIGGNIICSNFSVEYGAGVSHIGLSPGGKIHDNQIYYNDSVDSGAGIAIETELPRPAGSGLGDGSGTVDVDRNLIQSNYSGDDGGGIFVLDSLDQPINIRNNMIVDNGAADLGGAAMLDDASKVSLINDTIANNVSTGSSETSDGKPHSAGLAAEANDPLWQNDARYAAQYPTAATRPDFSNPVALFNNIFWDNNAFTLSQPGPGATLVNQGFIDLEIHGTTNNADTFTPRYSDLTNGQILGPDGVLRAVPAGQGNTSGDPGFLTPFTLELTVSGSRLDPQMAAVTITGADPPVGLTGDYHINLPPITTPLQRVIAATASPVVDRGVRCSQTPAPAPADALVPCVGRTAPPPPVPARGIPAPIVDIDNQVRPQALTLRAGRTPWDMGADEQIGIPIPIAAPGT